MRKFQEWQDNQVYFIHLNNLTNIKNRKPVDPKEHKPHSSSKSKNRSFYNLREGSPHSPRRENTILMRSIKTSFKPRRIRDKGRLEEKNLIYQNLLLGKRILETPSIVGNHFSRAASSVKPESVFRVSHDSAAVATWMQRSTRLRNFKNLEQEYLYVKGSGKHVLNLRISKMQCDQQLKSDDNHKMSVVVKIGKSYRSSEMVSTGQFYTHQFYLRFPRKVSKCNATVLIRYHAGNSDVEVGRFSLKVPGGEGSEQQQPANLYRKCGTPTGFVSYIIKVCKGVNDFHVL